MNKAQLLEAINSHPSFNSDRLEQLAKGRSPTSNILFAYLCELRGWLPLKVEATNHTDWYLVASSSQIGLWHKTSITHQACDCQPNSSTVCCHLSAVEAYEERGWIKRAAKLGFKITLADGNYQVIDGITNRHAADLIFQDNSWIVLEDRNQLPMRFDGVDEAIEYLAAIASFGWQLA